VWQQYFDQALADPNLSEFERRVLSTYRITDADYAEARSLFKQCMLDKGWMTTDDADGGYTFTGVPGSANAGKGVPPEVEVACQTGTTGYIEPLYFGPLRNPDGITWAQSVQVCFTAHNVPDGAGLSQDQFTAMVSDPNFHASTPQGKLCYYDPTGSLGMTIDQAVTQDEQPRSQATGTPLPDGGSVVIQSANSTPKPSSLPT